MGNQALDIVDETTDELCMFRSPALVKIGVLMLWVSLKSLKQGEKRCETRQKIKNHH